MKVNVIPKVIAFPQKGSPCTISDDWVIGAPAKLKKYAYYLQVEIKNILGLDLKLNNSRKEKTIKLKTNKRKFVLAHASNVSCQGQHIEILGCDEQGLFYGIQTLKQIFLTSNNVIPACNTFSLPGVKWRGMHLDVSRHFFPISYVKKVIDLMALFKLNRFHWHLTDDQGWRIESKKFPLLHEIGSRRDEEGYREAQYYTQEEIKELVAYAEERFIEVVPEIDMPGHTQSVLAAYPHLSCTGKPTEVWLDWGVSDEVLCLGKETTYEFVEELLDEIIPLFKSKYFHIGGDECPDTAWEKCEHCQKKLRELGLDKSRALQHQFTNFLGKILEKHDKILIGWDEITEGVLPENSAVMAWRGDAVKAAVNAMKQDKQVIFTPNNCYYLDWRQTDEEGEHGAFGVTGLKRVYQCNPYRLIGKSTNRFYKAQIVKSILGVQANLWTERIHNEKELEYMLFPRLLAIAEQAMWDFELNDFEEFENRVKIVCEKVLKHYDVNYCETIYTGIKQ